MPEKIKFDSLKSENQDKEQKTIDNTEKEIKNREVTPVYLRDGFDNWLKLVDEYRKQENSYNSEEYSKKLYKKSPLTFYVYQMILEGKNDCAHSWTYNEKIAKEHFEKSLVEIEEWKKENKCPIEMFDIAALNAVENDLKFFSSSFDHEKESTLIEELEDVPPILKPFQKYIKEAEKAMDENTNNKLRTALNSYTNLNWQMSDEKKFEEMMPLEIKKLKKDFGNAGWSMVIKNTSYKMINLNYALYFYGKECKKWAEENKKTLPKYISLSHANHFDIFIEARINNKLTAPEIILERIKKEGLTNEIISDFGYKDATHAQLDKLGYDYDRSKELPVISSEKIDIKNIPNPNELFVILSKCLESALVTSIIYSEKIEEDYENILITKIDDNGILINYKLLTEKSVDYLQKSLEIYIPLLKKWNIEWKKTKQDQIEIKIWRKD